LFLLAFLKFFDEKSKTGTALALVITERLFVAAVKTACLLECECNHGDSFLSLATLLGYRRIDRHLLKRNCNT
jgi:hypothetical protein